MKRVGDLLFNAVRPLWLYCLLAFPVAVVPSTLIFLAALGVLRLTGIDPESFLPPDLPITAGEFFGAVVVAPVVETFLLAWLIRLLSRPGVRLIVVASASALAWGSLHALFGALWFFGTVWSFFVFSCAYITWRKVSFKSAYAAAAIPHALINLTAMAIGAAVA